MGLLFDVLIYAIGGNLGSRARGVHLEGVFFVNAFGLSFHIKTTFVTAIMSFRVNVSLYFERFVESFRLSCSPL